MDQQNLDFQKMLEEASFAAWPAEEETRQNGWLMRYAGGYTKRANSANPLGTSSGNPEDIIRVVESFYRDRQLPPTFRLTPLAPPGFDQLLETRGYHRLDPTLVLVKATDQAAAPRPEKVAISELPIEEWLAAFNQFTGAPPDTHAKHSAILRRIQTPVLFGGIKKSGQVVACGLAVKKDHVVGLFDLITAPEARRQGHGTRLVASLTEWANTQEAAWVFLQVTEANTPPQALYQRVGYEIRYRYWYRRLPH